MIRSRLNIDTANPVKAGPGSDSGFPSIYFHIP